MNNNFRRIFIHRIISIGIICTFNFIFSQIDPEDIAYETDVTRRGSTAGAMLEIGVGARAEGLGGAFVAISEDPSALYWNPAGISRIKSLSIQTTKTNWFVDTYFNVIDLVVPIRPTRSTLGLHIAALDYGKNPVRTVFRPEGTGETYSAMDLCVGLYWAYLITPNVSVGLGAKYFSQRIWHESGSTNVLDVSILFLTPIKGLRLGGTINNLGPEFKLDGRDLTRSMDVDGRQDDYFNVDNIPIQLKTENYPLPVLFRFGLAYELEMGANNSLQTALNFNHPSNNVETIDLGIEAKLMKSYYLRAGYHSLGADYAADGLTLGCGLKYRLYNAMAVTVDYSYSDWTILSTVSRITIGISSN